MIRVEKFKLLLQERIADYAAKYKETGSQLIFGALQEAKDTLDYVEKQFPFLGGQYEIDKAKIKITVEVQKMFPGEASRKQRVVTMRDLGDGALRAEEHLVEEEKYFALESFFQFLVAERDNVLKWNEKDGTIAVELAIVMPNKDPELIFDRG